VQLAFESLLSAHQHVSAPSNVSRSLFAAPLFSQPYELLFPQALCFDNHLNCPGVWGCDASCGILPIQQSESQATPFQQLADSCTLFALFLRPAFFVFSNFQTLFVKHRGWGIPSQIPYRTAYPLLALRTSALSAPRVILWTLPIYLAQPLSFDFQLPTVDFPSINAKIHSNSL
jgi:hypothetical protein